MAEPSLGEGIGLQQGANRDDYWAKQIYARGLEKKAAREKADEDLINEADFKKDYSKFLPMYANKIAEIQQSVLQKVALARQANKNTARSVVAKDLYQAQLEIGKLEQDNARAMALIADDKTRKKPELINTLISPNSTFDDLSEFNDGQFIMADNTGTFAYRPVPIDYDKPKFDKYSIVGVPTGKRKIIGDTSYNELRDTYSQENIDAEINQLAQDRRFQEITMFETSDIPTPEGVDPIEFKKTLVQERAKEEVMKSLPKGAIRYDPKGVYHPPQGDKKDEPIKLRPLAQFDISSKVIDVDTGKPTNTKVPIQINLPAKINPTVIPTGIDVLDVETNKQVSDKPTNLSFTPSTLQYKNITRTKNGVKTKRNEWYVLGTAIDIAKANEVPASAPVKQENETEIDFKKRQSEFVKSMQTSEDAQKPGSKKTTYNVMVPLSSVRGALQGVDLSELDGLASEVDGKMGGDKISGSSYNINGKKYSEQDLLKLGYTPEQIASEKIASYKIK